MATGAAEEATTQSGLKYGLQRYALETIFVSLRCVIVCA